jgi:hypothetical protein
MSIDQIAKPYPTERAIANRL